jgi:hypothetical protein
MEGASGRNAMSRVDGLAHPASTLANSAAYRRSMSVRAPAGHATDNAVLARSR